eukprot:Hpha_TRINITY_DN3997_c0_g1::TRINITY_DN3997_c0_g1_i1::g.18003::m.18003
MGDCIRVTVRREGVRGLYAGFLVGLAEIAPYTALSFAVYEGAKQRVGVSSWGMKLGFGWLAGVTASICCYPVDTVKRQLMLDGSRGFDTRYQGSAMRCAARLWNDGGIHRLYRGYSATLMKSAPSVALTFMFNDLARDALNHWF